MWELIFIVNLHMPGIGLNNLRTSFHEIISTTFWFGLIIHPIVSLIKQNLKEILYLQFSSVQLLRCVWLCATPWIPACQASLSITNSRSLFKLMSIELVMPSSHLILRCPLLLLPSIFPSIRVFSKESVLCIRWPKCWSFSFSWISNEYSNEYSGLISFRMDWLDLLAVQGTFKSLLQYHSLKASILWCTALFMAQLRHLYMTIGKMITLTIQAFVGKVMSLIFNTLFRFVIAFLPGSKCLALISWLLQCLQWFWSPYIV